MSSLAAPLIRRALLAQQTATHEGAASLTSEHSPSLTAVPPVAAATAGPALPSHVEPEPGDDDHGPVAMARAAWRQQHLPPQQLAALETELTTVLRIPLPALRQLMDLYGRFAAAAGSAAAPNSAQLARRVLQYLVSGTCEPVGAQNGAYARVDAIHEAQERRTAADLVSRAAAARQLGGRNVGGGRGSGKASAGGYGGGSWRGRGAADADEAEGRWGRAPKRHSKVPAELTAREVDTKLWVGAAASGWRIVEAHVGGRHTGNWSYLSPDGTPHRTKALALAAASRLEEIPAPGDDYARSYRRRLNEGRSYDAGRTAVGLTAEPPKRPAAAQGGMYIKLCDSCGRQEWPTPKSFAGHRRHCLRPV